jgi:putative tricarboxylic transport membrane protein
MRFLQKVTYRGMEIGVACFLLLLMGLVLWESIRLGPGFGGSVAGSPVVGPRPGFFPFAMAVLVTFGAVVVLVQVWRERDTRAFLPEAQGVADLIQVGVPVIVAIALVPLLGLYIVAAAYVIAFGLWYERLRWYVVVPVGLALPGLVWWVLEQNFRLLMPKSPWYPAIPI